MGLGTCTTSFLWMVHLLRGSCDQTRKVCSPLPYLRGAEGLLSLQPVWVQPSCLWPRRYETLHPVPVGGQGGGVVASRHGEEENDI